jgi:poly(3-hydroxybutyrate) depolymerase
MRPPPRQEEPLKLLNSAAIALFVLIYASAASASGKITRSVIRFENKDRICTFFLPDGVTGPRPAILLLHGSGRNGRIMIDEWKDLAQKEGILLVAPDAYHAESWNLNWDSPDFLRFAIGKLHELHAVDLHRIYIFGHSAGAEYALILALLDSRLYAATAIHAGMLLPDFYSYLPKAERRMPIAIWSGDSDPNFPAVTVRDTAQRFEKNGFAVKLTIMPHHDHNYYAVSGEVNRKAWTFFKDITAPPAAPRTSAGN